MFLFVQAFSIGFTLHSNLPNGDCKTVEDWQADIQALRSWSIANSHNSGNSGVGGNSGNSYSRSATSELNRPTDSGGSSSSRYTPSNSPGSSTGVLDIRTFSFANCDTISNLVPLAIDAGMKIVPTMETVPELRYNLEKQVSLETIASHGCKWIASAIIVGDNTLKNVPENYDPDLPPPPESVKLASQITDMKNALKESCRSDTISITHAEQVDQWFSDNALPILDQVDLIGVNAMTVTRSMNEATNDIQDTLADFESLAEGAAIWITETGWPTFGSDHSVAEAANWWRLVNCGPQALFANYKRFWHEAFDNPGDPKAAFIYQQHLGVATSDRELKFDLSC